MEEAETADVFQESAQGFMKVIEHKRDYFANKNVMVAQWRGISERNEFHNGKLIALKTRDKEPATNLLETFS